MRTLFMLWLCAAASVHAQVQMKFGHPTEVSNTDVSLGADGVLTILQIDEGCICELSKPGLEPLAIGNYFGNSEKYKILHGTSKVGMVLSGKLPLFISESMNVHIYCEPGHYITTLRTGPGY